MSDFYIQDLFALLRRLTLRRSINILKVYSSYFFSRLTGKPVVWGLPFSVAIEPTTACNLSCPECPSGLKSFTRSTGSIRVDFFRQTIDQLYSDLLYLNFYFQGEPFLHKGFLDMVAYASSKGIYTSTSTNGHFFSDDTAEKTVRSGLDRVIISIDGATQESYAQYRVDGHLEKVLEGASKLIGWKKKLKSRKPMVVFQCIVFSTNEHEKDNMKALAKKAGADALRFKSAQILDYKNDPNSLVPAHSKLSRYQTSAEGVLVPRNRMPNHCWKMWHSNVITWDGKVVPCCFDKDAGHMLGDLRRHSMQEIWENKNYLNFRRRLIKSRKNIDICSNCSEGLRVFS